MELEGASRRLRLVRMEDHDRVSQASSVVTISSFPVKGSNNKVQTFGKRCRASKRDPNCPVVIRGWLNKKDSAGLRLWKRRWFVLSNYCLFYYKDSREEAILGSIPLPSYNILFCTPRECKNRKHTFKVVHQGMRSYFFSADTQEDMLGWVRALGQSAAMESDGSINRRCSSYQDFTQIGGSSESDELHYSPALGDGLSQKPRNVTRTQSEPSQLTGGRMGTPRSEQRGRRSAHQSPSDETPSPPEFGRRRGCVLNQEEDSLPYASGHNTPPKPAEFMGTGSLTPRGQLGSRPHTPVGRVDIRPQDDALMMPQTLCYAPTSPKPEFKSTSHTPVTERWLNLSKPAATYASVHYMPGRRPLGKSYSTGAHTDLLPPLPASSRATHAPHPPHHHHHHHHHHRSHLSVCVLPPTMPPQPELREAPPIRPLESDVDAVLTRLCGCDKLLQALSIELAQLQVDKDSVQCALEMTRLQLEDWKSMQGPRAQEGALTQKALLQEELVTIRARMCDVSLEMERVWSQYERMESELSVFRSHLQHICNFGMPQEQSQAQRELWMMEDILAGLRVNRDHFRLLLGLQRHQIPPSVFQQTLPHPGSPGSPTDRLPSGLPMGAEQEPPARPPLPQELQESNQSRDHGHGWMDPTYEGIYTGPVDPSHRGGNSQPDLLSEREHKDTSESQSSSKWTTPDTTIQSTKNGKMSEEEQNERMKRNQGRLANRKKPPLPSPGAQTQGQSSDLQEEVPFPLRVTRVVTAVLPSSLVVRRVSVEDPPLELATLLPEQIPPEMQQRLADQSKKILNKPQRRLLSETSDQSWSPAETAQDQSTQCLAKALQDLASERHEQNSYGPNTGRQQQHQHQNMTRFSREESWPGSLEGEPAENSRTRGRDRTGLGNGSVTSDIRAEGRPTVLATPDMDPDLCLTPGQREAKLRRVERIRERVIRSAVRESARATGHQPIRRERQDVHQAPHTLTNDVTSKSGATSDSEPHGSYGGCCDSDSGPPHYAPGELLTSSGTSQDEDEGDGHMDKRNRNVGSKTQHKDYSGRKGLTKRKLTPSTSPYHISSMTIYQQDGGKGFDMRHDDGQEEELEKLSSCHGESSSSSTNLRTKWFLSTNQWQGFIPLQNHGIEPLYTEETPDMDHQPEYHNSETDPNEISSIVCQSLEKMKENHSLFYKIACDINISDSDITRNDGDGGVLTSSKPDEGTELLTNESIPEEVTYSDVKPSEKQPQDSNEVTPFKSANASSEDNGNGISTSNQQQDSTLMHQNTQSTLPASALSNTSTKPARELCIYEEIPDKEMGEHNSSQENQLKVGENDSGASDQRMASDGASHQCAKTDEECSKMREAEERKVDRERSAELGKASSLCEESEEMVQERGNRNSITQSSSFYEEGRGIRSASFGKARVTVLRTSL